jgi:hypothetical protein
MSLSLIALIINTISMVACVILAIICRKQAKETERIVKRLEALKGESPPTVLRKGKSE